MATFAVPTSAVLELPDLSRREVRLTGIAPTGIWAEANDLTTLPFRSSIRVIFPGQNGAIGVQLEVVCQGPNGLGLELQGGADPIAKRVFTDWSVGKAASIDGAQSMVAPTIDLSPAKPKPAPRKSFARLQAPIGPPEETQPLPRVQETRRVAQPTPPPSQASSSSSEAGADRPRAVPFGTHDLMRMGRRKNTLKGKSVLVVEDDSGVAKLLQIGLTVQGAKVFVASDGLAALDIFRSRQVDVVLLDWMLPHMPAARVLAEIKKADDKRPIAVVSGVVTSATMRSEVRRLGADELFAKPFELARISDWIARVAPNPAETADLAGEGPARVHAAR